MSSTGTTTEALVGSMERVTFHNPDSGFAFLCLKVKGWTDRGGETTLRKDGKTKKAVTSTETWFVYILRCGDGTLYTGIAKDVIRRCEQHNAGPPRATPAVACQ